MCSLDCLHLAIRRRAFDRAWRRQLDAEALATLRIAFGRVITNMEELPVAVEAVLDDTVPMKG